MNADLKQIITLDAVDGVGIATTGGPAVIARWSPTTYPVVVQAVSFTPTSGADHTSTVLTFQYDTIGASSPTTIAVVTSSAAAVGKVVYKAGLNAEIVPGQEVEVSLTTAGGASTFARIQLIVKPSWEEPINEANALLSD